MAGIGFELRRLSERGDLMGIIQAYTHSAAASAGPWIFTIICLASITITALPFVGSEGVTNFRVIVTYNFAFSLVFTSPIVRITTRYLADRIYEDDVSDAPGMLVGALLIAFTMQLPLVLPFYFLFVDLPLSAQIQAVVNYFLVSGLWIVGIFLTALKIYTAVTLTFLVGFAVAFGAGYLGAQTGSIDGMLMGFNAGLGIIFFALVGRTLAEYPYPIRRLFAWIPYMKVYWAIGLSGLFYNIGIWIDKWVMWFAPEREELKSGFIFYGIYDSAMFLAYLSIIPSMAIFVLNVETRFYERYIRFYKDIEEHATLEQITQNHAGLLTELLSGIRNLIIFQATVSLLCIVFATSIFDALGVNYLQLGTFRFGVLGSFFHTLFLVLTIVLSYFDLRMQVLYMNALLMVANFAFTLIFLGNGFAYYGYGYFLATLFAFAIGAVVTFRELGRLPFLTFVRPQMVSRESALDSPPDRSKAPT